MANLTLTMFYFTYSSPGYPLMRLPHRSHRDPDGDRLSDRYAVPAVHDGVGHVCVHAAVFDFIGVRGLQDLLPIIRESTPVRSGVLCAKGCALILMMLLRRPSC
jgi:hypothetical protein